MPRFFFDTSIDNSFLRDEVGLNYADAESACRDARRSLPDMVAEAQALGLPIASHGDPRGTARRDLTTREGHGPRRVLQTSVRGPANRPLTLYYPATMDRARALHTWRARLGLLPTSPQGMQPAAEA